MVRKLAIALVFLAAACVTSTSVTRTGTGIFAPRESTADDDDETPRGLTLSVQSIAPDGSVILDLRNYSMESFAYSGTPDRARLVIEVESGNTHSRHTVAPSFRARRLELAAGERVSLKTNLGGLRGRVRIGIGSEEFRYIVWTPWMLL